MLLSKLKMLKRCLFILLMIQLAILTFVDARSGRKKYTTTYSDLCNKFEAGSVYRDVQNGCKARLKKTIEHRNFNKVSFSLNDAELHFMCRLKCWFEDMVRLDLVSVSVEFSVPPNPNCSIQSCKEWMETEQKRINQQIFKQYTIDKTDPPYSCEFKNDAIGANSKTIQITTNAKLILYDLNYQANYKIVKCNIPGNIEARSDEKVRYIFMPHSPVYSLEMQCSDSSKFNLRSQESNNHKTIDMGNECEPGSLNISSIVQDGRDVKFCRVLEHDGANEEVREESRNPACETVMTSLVQGSRRNRRVSYQMQYMEPIHRCTIKCDSQRFHALSISTEVFDYPSRVKCEIEACEQWMTSKSSVKGESFMEYKVLGTDPPKNCTFKSVRGFDSTTPFSVTTNMVNYIYNMNMEEEYTFESCTGVSESYSDSKERHTLLPHRPYFVLSLKCSENQTEIYKVSVSITQHEYDQPQNLSNSGGVGCHVEQVRNTRFLLEYYQSNISIYICGFYGEASADEDVHKTHPGCKLIMTIIEDIDKLEVTTFHMHTVIPTQRCSLRCSSKISHALTISSQIIKIDLSENCTFIQCEDLVTAKVVTMTNQDVKQYKILKTDLPQICTFKRKRNHESRDTYIFKTNVENIIYDWNSEDDYWIENCLEDYQPEIEVKHGLPPFISVFALEIVCGSYVYNLMSMKLSVHVINDFKQDCVGENISNRHVQDPIEIFFCDFFEQDGTADDHNERKIKYECKLVMTIKEIESTQKVLYQMATLVRTLRCSFKCDSSTFHVLSISSQTFEHNSDENCEIITCEDMMTSKLSATNKMFKQYTILKTNPSLVCTFNRTQHHGSINSFALMTNAENIIYDLNYAEDYMIQDCSMSSEDEVQVRYSLLPRVPIINLELKCSGSTVNLMSMHMSDYEMESENECQPGAISRISIVRDQNDVYFCDFNREDPTNAGNYGMENIYGCILIMSMEEINESQNVFYEMKYMEPIHRCTIKCGSQRFHALSIPTEIFEYPVRVKCEIETCEQWMTSRSSVKGEIFKEYKVLRTDPPKNCTFKSGRGIVSTTPFSITTNMVNYIYDLNIKEEYTFESCTGVSESYSDSKERHTLLPHRPYFTLSLKCSEFQNEFLSVNVTQHEYDRPQLLSSSGSAGCLVEQVRASRILQDKKGFYLCGVYGEESADEDTRTTYPGCKLIMSIFENVDTQEAIFSVHAVIPTQRCSLKCGSENRHVLSITSHIIKVDLGENCELTQCEELVTSKVVTMTNQDVKQYKVLKTNPPMICIFKRKSNHESINTYIIMTNAENIIYDLNYADDYVIRDCFMSSKDELQVRYSLLPHLPVFNLELKCSGSTVNLISMHMSDYEMESENECQLGAISRISIVRGHFSDYLGRFAVGQNDVYFCNFNREDTITAGNYEMENIYGCKFIMTMDEITESHKVVYTMRTIVPALRCTFKCGSELYHALTMSSQTFERDLGATCEIMTCEEMITAKLKTTNKLFKQYTVLKTNPPQICSLKHKHGISRRTYSIMTNADYIIYDLNYDDDYVIEDCAETSQPDGRVRYGLLPHIPAFTLEMKCGDITINILSVNPSDHEIMFTEQSDCYAQDFEALPFVQDIQKPSFAWDEGAAESIPSRFSVYRQFVIPKTSSPLTCTFSSADSPSIKLYTHGKWSEGYYINNEATGTSYTNVVCEKIEVLESFENVKTTIEIPSTDRLMKMDVTVNTKLYTLVSGIKYSWPSNDNMTYHYETYVPVFEVIREDRRLTYELSKIYPQVQCLYDSYENATLAYSDYYTDQTRSISFPAPQDLEFQSDKVKITNCLPILVPCGNTSEEYITNHETMLRGEQCFKLQIPKIFQRKTHGVFCNLYYNTTEEVHEIGFIETHELNLTDEMKHTFTIGDCFVLPMEAAIATNEQLFGSSR